MVGHVQHDEQGWQLLLREHGLRVTRARTAALQFIDEHPHCTAADLHNALQEGQPGASLQTAHNIVHDLAGHGLLRRVDLPETGAARYETRIGDNHHHVQCVVCGRIEDVDCSVGSAPCLTPAEVHGMRIFEADVTYRGVCSDCEGDLRSEADTASTAEPFRDQSRESRAHHV